MSYILDALRRAESERDRGAVPNIHAQPLAMTAAGSAPGRGSLAPWVVAGVALLVVGVLAWRLLDRKDAAPAAAPAVAMNSPAPATVPAPTPATTQPAAMAVQPASAVSMNAPPPAVVRAPSRPATPPPVRLPRPIERTVAQGDAPSAEAPPVTSLPATRAPAGATQGMVYNRNDLPADVQRQLPNLGIGGSAYSQDSASRMLIINGQVFHEGDPLGPDLTLEQIQLKAAVFRFKGYRYRITF